MKRLSIGLVSLAFVIAEPAVAADQAPSQADYDCANYGECGTQAQPSKEDGSVVVGETRGMNIAGRFGKKVSEPSAARPATPKAVGVRSNAAEPAVSSARPRVAAPVAAARPVVATAQKTRLKLAQGITFMSGSAELTPAARHNVNMLAASLLRADKLERRFRIEGYTDAVGDPTSNQLLSERRAAAVVSYLVSKGVDRTRLDVAGYGETSLLDGVAPGAAANRRVVANPMN